MCKSSTAGQGLKVQAEGTKRLPENNSLLRRTLQSLRTTDTAILNALPLFFISKQKHLGKGPEIILLVEAWPPVLRANLETGLLLPPAASGGAPGSAAGRSHSLRSWFNCACHGHHGARQESPAVAQ